MRFIPLILVLGQIMITTAPAADRAPELLPAGASLLWTSSDPLIASARAMVARDRLADAETLLRGATSGDRTAINESLETIARIRNDYPLDHDAIREKLRPSIRDLSDTDILTWTQSGLIQFRRIDGHPRYFRREPSNLFRFCPDAIARRTNPPAPATGFVLKDHLSQVVKAAAGGNQTRILPVRHRVKFTIRVPPHVSGYKRGALLKAWLPYPQEYGQRQTDVKLLSGTPPELRIAPNGAIHRTLYFERVIEDVQTPTIFEVEFEFTSHAHYPALDDAKVRPLPADFPRDYLAERPPHTRFSPELKQIVSDIIRDETNPLARARKIFHWLDANIRYNAEEEYSIIPSFSDHALQRRRGDCGIQATLFVTMCRAAGVPARWQSGWQTKPAGQHNMHDWAEFYVAPWGWLPCDPSYGLQQSDDPAVREFYFGHQDSYRMIVNLDYGGPLTPEKKSLRSEPADFQRGEVELGGRNLYFHEFEYNFDVKHVED